MIFKSIKGYDDYEISKEGVVFNKKIKKFIATGKGRCLIDKHRLSVAKLIQQTFYELELINLEPIKDFENYQISKDGRIFSNLVQLELECSPNTKSGYKCVTLDGKTLRLHRLLAIQYISNPDHKEFVDHIDGDILNNDLSNLRWATMEENNCNRWKNKNTIYKGVSVGKHQYLGHICKDKKHYWKCFQLTEKGLIDALKWRKDKEIEFFGEFIRSKN